MRCFICGEDDAATKVGPFSEELWNVIHTCEHPGLPIEACERDRNRNVTVYVCGSRCALELGVRHGSVLERHRKKLERVHRPNAKWNF